MLPKKDGMFFNAFEGLESMDSNAPPRRGHHRNKKAKPISDVERQQTFLEGLVIMGYESNLFRNDKLSESIERGEHFIPWMGKEDLMIDRYDARALLTDLKLFDRQAGKWDALPRSRKPSDPKYERELKLNKKLDKERYWDMVLHGEDVYKEEERKRQKMQQDARATYSLVGLDYGEITKHEDEEEQQKRQEEERRKALEEAEAKRRQEQEEARKREEEEKYQAPHPVPEGMIAPALKKMGVIIEKTAAFLFRQGPEAVNTLKRQQKDNPMFLFLVDGHPLNPYLKFLIGKLEEAKKREEEEKEKANEFALSLVAEYNDEEEPFKEERQQQQHQQIADAAQTEPITPAQKQTYVAMFDFAPEKEGEMGMKVGEVLAGRETVDGWLEVERDGQVGYVPRGWVKQVEHSPDAAASSQATGAGGPVVGKGGDEEDANAAAEAAAKRKRMMRAKLLAQLITTGKEHVVHELRSGNSNSNSSAAATAPSTKTAKAEEQEKARQQEERERAERRRGRRRDDDDEEDSDDGDENRRRRKRRRSRSPSRSRSRSPGRGERERRRDRSGSRESGRERHRGSHRAERRERPRSKEDRGTHPPRERASQGRNN